MNGPLTTLGFRLSDDFLIASGAILLKCRIGIDPAILQPGHLARRPSVNDALGISIEKRQIQRLIDINGIRAIGNERMEVSKAVRQGASPDRLDGSGTAAYAEHTKVREQTETP